MTLFSFFLTSSTQTNWCSYEYLEGSDSLCSPPLPQTKTDFWNDTRQSFQCSLWGISCDCRSPWTTFCSDDTQRLKVKTMAAAESQLVKKMGTKLDLLHPFVLTNRLKQEKMYICSASSLSSMNFMQSLPYFLPSSPPTLMAPNNDEWHLCPGVNSNFLLCFSETHPHATDLSALTRKHASVTIMAAVSAEKLTRRHTASPLAF